MFDDVSSGAYGDFKSATQIARLMVTKLGMSVVGPTQESSFSDKKLIDQEVKKIIDESMDEARKIVKVNKTLLEQIANKLLETSTIAKDQLDKLIESKNDKKSDKKVEKTKKIKKKTKKKLPKYNFNWTLKDKKRTLL
ncbi:MAG: hypothetical protein AB3N34_02555 [Lettuce witches'-broom phytoplasma]